MGYAALSLTHSTLPRILYALKVKANRCCLAFSVFYLDFGVCFAHAWVSNICILSSIVNAIFNRMCVPVYKTDKVINLQVLLIIGIEMIEFNSFSMWWWSIRINLLINGAIDYLSFHRFYLSVLSLASRMRIDYQLSSSAWSVCCYLLVCFAI